MTDNIEKINPWDPGKLKNLIELILQGVDYNTDIKALYNTNMLTAKRPGTW